MPSKKTEKQLSLLPVSGVKRATVSLPSDLLSTLDIVSSMAGVSRSAFLSAVLARILPSFELAVIRRALSANACLRGGGYGAGHDAVMKRYSDASKRDIDDLIASLSLGDLEDVLNRD